MEGTMAQYPPGDPKMIDTIVHQLKSQGIFDQFRKECIADVDTKPAYQNLHQRVEGTVSAFLANQVWRPEMNKNLLRDSLRKHIHESGFLDMGVERIVDQVVNPKVLTVFVPQVEEVVYNFLGIEKPKKSLDTMYTKLSPFGYSMDHSEVKKEVSLTDLLPKDLDPISPESDKKADNSTEEGELNDDQDEQSPPFKPLRDLNENSGSSISGISGLTSPDGRHSAISFNGILGDRPVTPSMSPVRPADEENQIPDSATTNNLLIHNVEKHNLNQPLDEMDHRSESNQSRVSVKLPTEEPKLQFVEAEPVSSDDEDGDTSGTSSRPSSSNSNSSTSSDSSSSGASSDSSHSEEDKQVAPKSTPVEEKPAKKEKLEPINKDEPTERVLKDRRDDKPEIVAVKHELDDKLIKKYAHNEKHIKKMDSEEKVSKVEEKEKKPLKTHEKNDKSTKKYEKEAAVIKTWEREEKLFSTFDQGETIIKRVVKEEKTSSKIAKEEKPFRNDDKEEKMVRHVEKDSTHMKVEKIGKSPHKDLKDVKSLKIIEKSDKSLHKNGDGKLSSKEADVSKKSVKKDMKEDKSIKSKVDDKVDKSTKSDDRSSKNVEKDGKALKKEGKHKVDTTDSSSQESKPAESKVHSSKSSESSHLSQKSLKPMEKERGRPTDKSVSKDDKLKPVDTKSKSADRSKPSDKSRHDEKYKIKNGNTDKERSSKQESVSKNSSGKEKSHKQEGEKQEVKTDPKSKHSSKHKDGKKEKGKLADDHGRHRDKRSDDRGSTDRDSNGTRDRSSSSSRTPAAGSSRESGHREKKGGGGSSSGRTGKGGNNDASERTPQSNSSSSSSDESDGESPAAKMPKLEVDPLLPCKGEYICINNEGKLVLKIKKPKIAANIFEVRKIMQQRRSLAKLEKKRQREFRRAQGIYSSDESPTKKDVESSSPRAVQPVKIAEILQPAEIPEIIQPVKIPEVIQPAEIPEIDKPARTPKLLQHAKIPEIIQPVKIPEVIQPAEIPEIFKPVRKPKLLQHVKIPEINQPSEIPEVVQPAKTCDVIQPAKIPESIQPSVTPKLVQSEKILETSHPAKHSKVTRSAEIPKVTKVAMIPITRLPSELSKQSLTVPAEIPSPQSTQPVSIPKLIETEVHSPAKVRLPSTVPTPVEMPLMVAEYETSDNDDGEPDVRYFEVPVINEYDKLFLSYMKELRKSETLSDLDVCSVHSDDLDDFSDSSSLLLEDDRKDSYSKYGGTVWLKDLCVPVCYVSLHDTTPKLSTGDQADVCIQPSNKTTDNSSVSGQKNSGLKSSQAVVNKPCGKASGILLNDDRLAESTIHPVSVKSKTEAPKRIEDHASTVPTVRPQLPNDIASAGFPTKSPIPVGALSRHKVKLGRPRKVVRGNLADTKTKSPPLMRPPMTSPPPAEKREMRRSRKPNQKYINDDNVNGLSESQAKSLPVTPSVQKKLDVSMKDVDSLPVSESPLVQNKQVASMKKVDSLPVSESPLVQNKQVASMKKVDSLPVSESPSVQKKQDASMKKVDSLTDAEIFDIVVGNVSEYGGINNNVHIIPEKDDTAKTLQLNNLKAKNIDKGIIQQLAMKDNMSMSMSLRLERVIPTPESHTSGSSSSSGSVEVAEKPKLGPCRRLGLSRVTRVATPPGADFVMPLSPESDVSASSGDKKVSASPKTEDVLLVSHDSGKQSQSGAILTPASRGQRYSSDDLYKPRPLFNHLSRRTRGTNLDSDDKASDASPEIVGSSATKRRASNVASPDVAPMPKRRR